jgi:hypothetical protein
MQCLEKYLRGFTSYAGLFVCGLAVWYRGGKWSLAQKQSSAIGSVDGIAE